MPRGGRSRGAGGSRERVWRRSSPTGRGPCMGAARLAHRRFSSARGGLLTGEDFGAHRVEWVEPIGVDYRGVRVTQLPPNSQGIALLQMLGTARGRRRRRLGLTPSGCTSRSSARSWRLPTATRLSPTRRASDVPVARMLDGPRAAVVGRGWRLGRWRHDLPVRGGPRRADGQPDPESVQRVGLGGARSGHGHHAAQSRLGVPARPWAPQWPGARQAADAHADARVRAA